MPQSSAARSTPFEPVSNRSLKDVLIEEAGYTPYEDWAWQGYRPSILALAKEYGLTRLMEIGGGRRPLFTPEECEGLGFETTINDISSVELESMKVKFPKFPAVCFDVSGDISSPEIKKGHYDLIYSRMVFEHVKDVEQAWKNVYQLLVPGGVAIAFYPTLYALPFLVNKVIPESVSSKIVDVLYGFRKGRDMLKFPAYYDHCYGDAKRVEPMLQKIGFSDTAVLPFYGHDYFKNLPVLREIDNAIHDLARRKNLATLSSYAYAVVRK
jgi:SAM-dependent methyltransferase